MPTLHVKQPLAIVGASTRSAAASAVRAGFHPAAADLFADADLRQIAISTRISPYPDGFVDWLRAIEPPAWMYTGALENHPELVDQMAWIATLLGNPGDVLARVRSPWALAHALRNAGLLFPETRAITEEISSGGSWLVKTCRGASGSGVTVWSGQPSDKSTKADGSNHAVYQRRVDGTPCAAVYVAADGSAQLLGTVRQLIGEPWLEGRDFRYAGSIGPLPLTDAVHNALANVGNVLAAEFELVGLFGVDFIIDDKQQIWTIEVNPRYTASVEIIERITGISALAAHVAACGGSPSARRAGLSSAPAGGGDARAHNKLTFHGKAILFAKGDVEINQSFADFTFHEALRTPWPTLADISPAGTPIEAGRPVLTVFAEGSSADEVEQRLRDRVAELEHILYT
ncbi:MAG TPA: ATP-grasp domain-containing protein [Lacipirellulaceae bacterium]|nr:ATP-grasp domain-containing protein [Lacipirellulaceae bacterium]